MLWKFQGASKIFPSVRGVSAGDFFEILHPLRCALLFIRVDTLEVREARACLWEQPFQNILMTTLRIAGFVLVLAVVASCGRVGAQQMQKLEPMARDAHPSFEVASIKLANPDDQSSGFQTNGRRVFIENETMNDIISFAYGVHAKQIIGAPPWFGTLRFDIRGLPDVEGIPNTAQYREMVIKLLADRFQLKFHRDKREMACYALTVAKGGPKMEASKSEGLQDQTGNNNGGRASWRFTNNSMEEFAKFLQWALDRPVVDQTGLQGKYDFKLTWTKDNAPATDENAAPGFFTAIQEQAGLKVEPSKAEVDVLAIDHAVQPSAD